MIPDGAGDRISDAEGAGAPAALSGVSILWAAGGALWGLVLVVWAGLSIKWTYQPYDGVAGLPAYWNDASGDERFYYWGGVALAALCARVFVAFGRRIGSGAVWRGLVPLFGGALALFGLLHKGGSTAADTFSLLISSPARLTLLFIVMALSALLLRLPMSRREDADGAADQPDAGPYRLPWAEIVALILCINVIWRVSPWQGLGAALARLTLLPVGLIWLAQGVANGFHGLERRPRREPGRRAARIFYIVFAAGSLWGVYSRLSIGPDGTGWMAALVVPLFWLWALASLGLMLAQFLHRPALSPVWLLPFAFGGLLAAGIPVFDRIDPFHQGEFTYPAFAMSQGLAPWRGVFLVHGFGVDTLPGVFGGLPSLGMVPWHAQDLIFTELQKTLMAAGGFALLLFLWGRAWWPVALAVAALPLAPVGYPAARALPMWLGVGMAMLVVRGVTPKRCGAAGALCVAGMFYSLDTGAGLCLAMTLWMAWIARLGRDRRPLGWFAGGMAALAVPILLLLVAAGMLGDMWTLHLEYARIKPHYDKIPMEWSSLGPLFSPLATALGLLAIPSLRKRQWGPLEKIIPLFLLLNILSYLRALDRSDAGHVAYGSMMAWPLLGTLIVWRSGGAAEDTRPGLRPWAAAAALLACGMLSANFAQPLTKADVPVVAQLSSARTNAARGYFVRPGDPASAAFLDIAGDIALQMPAKDTFYDFSNHPSLYVWTRHVAPTRFFTAFYAAGMKWQDEVVADLENKKVPWIIWRSANPGLGEIDGMPACIRQWRIAQYILSHYHLAGELPTPLAREMTKDNPDIKWGGVLLHRNGAEPPDAHAPAFASTLSLWGQNFFFNYLPRVWGASPEGSPPVPGKVLATETVALSAAGTALTLPPGFTDADAATSSSLPATLVPPAAKELQITFKGAVHDGACRLNWASGTQPQFLGEAIFSTKADFAGPYRLMLGNLPTWAWCGRPEKLELKAENDEIGSGGAWTGTAVLEWRGE